MTSPALPPLLSPNDSERVLEFEFVRATENAALNAIHWLGRGEKELADAAACDAIYGVFDILDIRGEVVIGEGIKDNAPGIFVGEKLGTWREGSPRFNIALDPVDGTTNLAKGMPNAISVIAAAQIPDGAPPAMQHLPAYYSHKIAFGPAVAMYLRDEGAPCLLDMPLPRSAGVCRPGTGKTRARPGGDDARPAAASPTSSAQCASAAQDCEWSPTATSRPRWPRRCPIRASICMSAWEDPPKRCWPPPLSNAWGATCKSECGFTTKPIGPRSRLNCLPKR